MNRALGLLPFLITGSLLAQQKDSIRVYYKCVNEISVAQLFQGFKPNESIVNIKGARMKEVDKAKGFIAVVPDSAVVTVQLQKKNKIASQVNLYSVRPPQPLVELNIDGKTHYSFSTLSGPPPSALVVNLVADELFRMSSPKDAIYKIKKWELALKRGNQTLKQIAVTEGISAVELAGIKTLSQANDVLQIRILLAQRQNGIGEWVDQPLTRSSLLYTIGK